MNSKPIYAKVGTGILLLVMGFMKKRFNFEPKKFNILFQDPIENVRNYLNICKRQWNKYENRRRI